MWFNGIVSWLLRSPLPFLLTTALAIEEQENVTENLRAIIKKMPNMVRYLNIQIASNRTVNLQDLYRAAKDRVIIQTVVN